MIPWLWFWMWAPQVHFPWSGSVAQRIEPNTNWFFDAIQPDAGDAAIERRAFEVASYGRQLGLLTEALLGLADAQAVDQEQTATALSRLKDIRTRIEAIKADDNSASAQQVIAQLKRLRSRQPEAFQQIAKKFLI